MVQPASTRSIQVAGIAALGLLASAFAIQIYTGQRQQIRTLNAEVQRLTLEREQLVASRNEEERYLADLLEIMEQVEVLESQPRVPTGPMPYSIEHIDVIPPGPPDRG